MNTLSDTLDLADLSDEDQVEVLRLELRSWGQPRIGPYHATVSADIDALSDLLADLHFADDSRPAWIDDHFSYLRDTDPRPVFYDALYAGTSEPARPLACFLNWEQYDAWFDDQDIKDLLKEMEFKLVSYRVPAKAVLKSSSQGIFDYTQATEVVVFPSL